MDHSNSINMDSILEERAAIITRLRTLYTTTHDSFRSTLEDTRHVHPTVILVTSDGERVEFLYPDFTTREEQSEAFEKVNAYITESGALGALSIIESWWVWKDDLVEEAEIPDNPKRVEVLVFCIQSHGFGEYYLHMFHRDNGGKIVWDEMIGPEGDFIDDHITAFRGH